MLVMLIRKLFHFEFIQGQFYNYKEAIILANYSIQEQTVSNFKKDKVSMLYIII